MWIDITEVKNLPSSYTIRERLEYFLHCMGVVVRAEVKETPDR